MAIKKNSIQRAIWRLGGLLSASMLVSIAGIAFAAQLNAKRLEGGNFAFASTFPSNAQRVCFTIEGADEPLVCTEEVLVLNEDGELALDAIGTIRGEAGQEVASASALLPPSAVTLVRAYAENAEGRSDPSADVFVADRRVPDIPQLLEFALDRLDDARTALNLIQESL